MARIGVAGLQHETNTFAASRARFRNFVEADAWPGLLCGEEMLPALRGVNLPASGMIAAAQAAGHQVVPLSWASANPCGHVTDDAFEALWWIFERQLRAAGPLDALLLELHGAMVTESQFSGDEGWLARVREVVGPELPIVVVLDFHANITPRMTELADLILVYRTYPHVDMAECGERAVSLLPALLAGRRYAHAFRQLPYLIPMPWQSTLAEPMASLMREAEALSDRVSYASLAAGFPLADVPDSAPSVLVYAETQAAADAGAAQLYDALQRARGQFAGRLWQANEAVAYAMEQVGTQPVILADTQDNPGGGGDSDTADLIHALLAADAQGACLGLLCDPQAAAAAHAAGVGAVLDIAIGATSSAGGAAPGPWQVEQLGNGQFTGTGPFYAGCHMDLGPMARLRRNGVTVLVSSRKQQAADQAMFRHLGVEPARQAILVLKSSVHFRADFAELAQEILVVAASGSNVADLHQLQYRHCQRPAAG
ncbi:M81 family metallopeptidase [Leeia sp.]|uniref:M81 family metallopeptidase n=1 Tax=Leeia sp. TaxID=2884678 RepID=UPI0035AE6538